MEEIDNTAVLIIVYSYSEEDWTGSEVCKFEEIWQVGEVYE